MKLLRVVAVLVAALLAALAVWSGTRPPAGAPSGAPPATGTRTPGADWRPEVLRPDDTVPAARTPAAAPPTPAPPEIVPVGTPAAAGQAVDVAAGWRPGAGRFRYEIEDATVEKDMEGPGVNASRRTLRVSVEVLEGDGTGAARVRLTLDSFRDQVIGPDGLTLDYDSRIGDPGTLALDPILGPTIRTQTPLLGKPLAFRLDPQGRIVDVDGSDEWRRAYLDAVATLDPSMRAGAPSAASIAASWAEYLFPPIGTGTITVGAPRAFVLRQPLIPPHDLVWSGRADVTRNDPGAFRVDVVAKPAVERGVGAVTEGSAALAGIRAVASDDAYRAGWRFARTAPSGLLEAQIDVKFQLWMSMDGDRDAKGATQYQRTFTEISRRVIVRRTDPPVEAK